MILVAACAKSTQPIGNTTHKECGGLVWVTKLDKPSTPESHRAVAMRLLETTGMRASYSEMLEISLQSQLKANPALAQFEAGMREFFDKYASFDAIAVEFAELYMRTFDELQLRQIDAFYQTPTGKRAVKELANIMREGAKIGERNVQAHQKELIEILTKSQQGSSPTIAPP